MIRCLQNVVSTTATWPHAHSCGVPSPCSLLSLRVHHITNGSRVAYKSLTFAAVLTVHVNLERRHSLSLVPPSRMVLPGPCCTELSIAGFGWKVRFSRCGDSKLATRAERVFERYSAMGCSIHTIRVIYIHRNDA